MIIRLIILPWATTIRKCKKKLPDLPIFAQTKNLDANCQPSSCFAPASVVCRLIHNKYTL